MLLNETQRNKKFSTWKKRSRRKKSSGHFQSSSNDNKDKGNCSLAGMTWLFIDKLADLPLRKEVIKMVTEKKKIFCWFMN